MMTIVIIVASLALAAGASAGEFHVYSCRTPTGESAPTEGWSGSVPEGVPYVYANNTCGKGGALIAALGDQGPHTVGQAPATWMFSAPVNDVINNATLWRAGDADGGAITNASYKYWLAGPNDLDNPTNLYDQCSSDAGCPPPGVGNQSQPLSPSNRLPVTAEHLGMHLYLNVSCEGWPGVTCQEGVGDQNEYAAVVYMYAADITLEQTAGPTASNVSGELASAPAVSGSSDVAFDASDPGAGVWEAVFAVDGNVVQRTVLNENGGRCRNVGQTTDGLPAFLYVQPCPPTVSVDVPFDTASSSNGVHHLVVSVLDAAGNAAPVLDKTIDVNNPVPVTPGPPNGTNASAQATLTARWASTTRTRLTTRYGRVQTIVGRLTAPGGGAGGIPIKGALVEIGETPAYTGSKTAALESPRTAANGDFSVRLPGGMSSSTLRIAYRAHLGDLLPAATRTLTLAVRAGVTLSVAPHTTSVGRSIHFRGVLHGAPLPAGGKQLVLEARSPGGPWIEFDVIRTTAKGRFKASYRFKVPRPRALPVPRAVEVRSRVPVRGRRVERGGGVRAVSAT